jgi:(R,R)-butanediol dehydrogenase / meso-butanediol dehydrogenase / diacetyl reductase
MLATVYQGRHDVRSQDWPSPPPPPPGWVTVAVGFCGICGTDVDEILNGPVLIPTEPHPLTGRQLPLVLGHEGMGVVVAAGDGAGIDVGTRVGMENSVGCTTCERCRAGMPQLCERMAAIGLMLDGALAEAVNVPASMCVAIPDGVPDEIGAIAEPLSVAVRAVRRAGDVRGQTVQVFGAGPVGLFTAQVARAQGARSVLVREPHPSRRAVASRLGFEADAPDAGASHAQVVFECSGQPAGFENAVSATAKSGVTVIVGVHPSPQPVDLCALVLEERAIVASLSHTLDDDYRPAMELLAAHRIDWEAVVSDCIPLDRVIEHGFRRLIEEPQPHMKILVDCRG